ncbi:hypothetical protein [Aureliella helgolandensis]|uniref:Uncharacterized protein n=1 Tax=Aureliella helgolandensis TaxID=2527968 RepID=A0A518G679_9BACT|nr:hypothetical protein [Aureliella helgolandensis]QDV24074.1 hypothetical protein Q31a_23870 [Aureliella helgolandensis]
MKTTLAIFVLCLSMGCSQTAITPTLLQITASPDPSNNDDSSLTLVSFHPPVKSEIIVETTGQRSTILFDPRNPNADMDSVVRFAAERKRVDGENDSKIKTTIRPETPNGGSAGGSTTESFSVDTSLNEILTVTIPDGEYPIGKAIEIGTYKNSPVLLTVRPVSH